MRKFATPIGSSQYPANGITLSLTQIPVSIQAPAVVTECPPCPGPDCECSFDDLLFFGVNYNPFDFSFYEFKIGNSISILNGMTGTFGVAAVGSNLTSANFTWNITWSFADEEISPLILYQSGFFAVIYIPPGMQANDTITASATACNTTKTAILTMSGGA